MIAYAIGENTGNYTVSYTPLVRGEYTITVQKPAVWEVQLVQTVSEESGEELSGANWTRLHFVLYSISVLSMLNNYQQHGHGGTNAGVLTSVIKHSASSIHEPSRYATYLV